VFKGNQRITVARGYNESIHEQTPGTLGGWNRFVQSESLGGFQRKRDVLLVNQALQRFRGNTWSRERRGPEDR